MGNNNLTQKERKRNIEERIWSLSNKGVIAGTLIAATPIVYGLVKKEMGFDISQTENYYIFNVMITGGIIGYASISVLGIGRGLTNLVYRRRKTN